MNHVWQLQLRLNFIFQNVNFFVLMLLKTGCLRKKTRIKKYDLSVFCHDYTLVQNFHFTA